MEGWRIWWRRPRLIAAVACAGLGVLVLVAGPLLRDGLTGPAAPALEAPAADELDGFADLEAPPADPEAPEPEQPGELVVYISGAVALPDVYRLPAGARVKDAVLAAGGLLALADGAAVNLAAPLSDAAHIHIPHQGEVAAPAPVAAGGGSGQIDLNSASPAQLEELPGVGKAIAARIVARRESEGPYASVADLREVAGVGESLYAQIAPLVTVGGAGL